MAYYFTSPVTVQTWGTTQDVRDKYSRLSQRKVLRNAELSQITDVNRGLTLIWDGHTLTANQFPYQTDMENAVWYLLGGHEQVVTDAQAAILIANGYGNCLTPIP